jgi:transcriptional regulator with XRE-family HTH domain
MDVLRKLRKERGWSQRELADEAGTTQYTVSEIEQGHRDPHPTTLRKLAEALGVSVAEFFGEETADPKAPAELPLEDTQQRDSAVIKALRTYFWDLRFRWKEPGNNPSPEQIRDALDLLQHLLNHGAFKEPLTPREQSEVKLLFNAAYKLRPIVEERIEEAEDNEAAWLKPMSEEVFAEIGNTSSS